MTYDEKCQMMQRCSQCPHHTHRPFYIDNENEIVSPYYTGRKYRREFNVCKLESCVCHELDKCPLPDLTEEEIEERETAFDEQDEL